MKLKVSGAVIALLFPAVAFAQGTRPATYITKAQVDELAGGQPRGDRRLAMPGQELLGLAGSHLQQARVLVRKGLELGLLDDPAVVLDGHARVRVRGSRER